MGPTRYVCMCVCVCVCVMLCVWLTCIALMSAAIFGNVSSIMLRLYRGTEEYHERCHSIREFIRFYRVPADLASRLLDAYTDRRCRANGADMLAVSLTTTHDARCRQYRPGAYDVHGDYEIWLQNIVNIRYHINQK